MKRIFLSAVAVGALGTAAATAAPVQWTVASGGNGHWYDFVTSTTGLLGNQAETLAEASTYMGANGYLATITSAAEKTFLNSIWPTTGTIPGNNTGWRYYLIGASDRASEGTFKWIGGPEDGQTLTYTNWSAFEPNNNSGSGPENYVVGWWMNQVGGQWNDVNGAYAYLVEYGGTMAPVPLPAGLPLLAGALGALVLLRRRKGA